MEGISEEKIGEVAASEEFFASFSDKIEAE
jgi:hypothetical protein